MIAQYTLQCRNPRERTEISTRRLWDRCQGRHMQGSPSQLAEAIRVSFQVLGFTGDHRHLDAMLALCNEPQYMGCESGVDKLSPQDADA